MNPALAKFDDRVYLHAVSFADAYRVISKSRLLPHLDFDLIEQCIALWVQPGAVRAYRRAITGG